METNPNISTSPLVNFAKTPVVQSALIINGKTVSKKTASSKTSVLAYRTSRNHGDNAIVRLQGESGNPFTFGRPTIDLDVEADFAPGQLTRLTVNDEGFPSLEVIVDDQVVYSNVPKSSLEVLMLFPKYGDTQHKLLISNPARPVFPSLQGGVFSNTVGVSGYASSSYGSVATGSVHLGSQSFIGNASGGAFGNWNAADVGLR